MKENFYAQATPFIRELYRDVRKHFADKKVLNTGDKRLRSKSIVLISSALLLYGGIAAIGYFAVSNIFALLLCPLLGIALALIGFNVMHDGSHDSYSKNPKVNYRAALSLNAMGADSFIWREQHCNLHHGFTNIPGHDNDINQNPWMRLHPKDKWRWIHQYQYIYGPLLLYAQEYWYWILVGDFKSFFKGKIGSYQFKKMEKRDRLVFWGGKVLHMLMMVILPRFVFHFSYLEILTGYFTMALTCGFFISMVFQLAHLQESTRFYSPEEAKKVSWAECQVRTTSNFATKSKLLSWLLGGLNFQIEHHLLPHVSHVHYPELALIVEQKCLEYGYPYNKPRLDKAFGSHIKFLRRMGKKPVSIV